MFWIRMLHLYYASSMYHIFTGVAAILIKQKFRKGVPRVFCQPNQNKYFRKISHETWSALSNLKSAKFSVQFILNPNLRVSIKTFFYLILQDPPMTIPQELTNSKAKLCWQRLFKTKNLNNAKNKWGQIKKKNSWIQSKPFSFSII